MLDNQSHQHDKRHRCLHVLIALLALVCLVCGMVPAYAGSGARGDVALINLDTIKDKHSLAGQWQLRPGDAPEWATPVPQQQ